MNTLYLDGGIVAGSYTPLGRDELGLAVKKGAPHPDISTVEKLAAVLKSAQAVEVNDPKAGTMQGVIIDGILKRPEFAGDRTGGAAAGRAGRAHGRHPGGVVAHHGSEQRLGVREIPGQPGSARRMAKQRAEAVLAKSPFSAGGRIEICAANFEEGERSNYPSPKNPAGFFGPPSRGGFISRRFRDAAGL